MISGANLEHGQLFSLGLSTKNLWWCEIVKVDQFFGLNVLDFLERGSITIWAWAPLNLLQNLEEPLVLHLPLVVLKI